MFQEGARTRVYTDVDAEAFTLNGVSLLYAMNSKVTADFMYVNYMHSANIEIRGNWPYVAAGFISANSTVPL